MREEDHTMHFKCLLKSLFNLIILRDMRNRIIRFVAGTLVLTGLILGYFVNPYWFILTAFVGLNLFQSSLTQWCLLEDILKSRGIEN